MHLPCFFSLCFVLSIQAGLAGREEARFPIEDGAAAAAGAATMPLSLLSNQQQPQQQASASAAGGGIKKLGNYGSSNNSNAVGPVVGARATFAE